MDRILAGWVLLVVSCASALAIPVSVGAAPVDEPVLMPELQVSASRLTARLDEVAASSERLDRNEIEALGAASTAELFRGMSGVQVDGGGAGPAYVHLRGADPNLTLILVDGVAVNDPTDARGGAFDLRELDPSEIERIEVVRGPVSAIHGSDAMAGVIQIVTRQARNAAWSRVEVGDFDFRSLSAGLGGASEEVRFDLRLHDREGGQDVARQQRRSRGAGAKGRVRLGADSRLRWSFSTAASRELRYREDSGGPRYATSEELESEDTQRRQLASRFETSVGRGVDLQLSVTALDLERQLDSPAIAPGLRDPVPATTNVDRLTRSELGADLRWAGDQRRLAVGAQAQFEDGRSRGTLDQGFVVPTDFDRYRRTGSVYIEASRATSTALTVEAALRWDAIDALRPQLSSRLGAIWKLPRGGFRLRASGGQGYQAPSFFAVAHPLVGNPDLVPEQTESYELGIGRSAGADGGLEMDLVMFFTDTTDLIDFDSTIFRMVNRDAVDTRGMELRVSRRIDPSWALSGQVQYAKTKIRETGKALLDRPQWTASFDVDYRWRQRAGLHLRTFYQGQVPDSSVPTGDRSRDSFVRLDLSASGEIHPDWSLVAAIENLLDESYEEGIGIPGRGRFARVGIRVER